MKKKNCIIGILIFILIFLPLSLAFAVDDQCGPNAYWSFDKQTGILKIWGTGRMYDFNLSHTPWAEYIGWAFLDKIKGVEISEGITYIGDNSFYNFDSASYIHLPSTLTEIGEWVFYSCGGPTFISVPSGVKKIGKYAFYNSNIKNIKLPASLTSIEYSAFFGSGKLTNIYYSGTKTQWNSITIDEGNDPLNEATLHTGYSPSFSITYTWASNYSSVTATRYDENCPFDTESETVSTTSKVSTQPTCTKKGKTTYTTKVFSNSVFSKQTKTVTNIPALGHTVVIDHLIEPTYVDTGLTEGSHCSVCNTILVQQEVIPSICKKILWLPADLQMIEEAAFKDVACDAVVIPNSCTYIAPYAFQDCKNLIYVQIPLNTQVQNNSFYGCVQNLVIERKNR